MKNIDKIEKDRKERQKKLLEKQEQAKSNLKSNRYKMIEGNKMLKEKNEEKLMKVEMSKQEKEDFLLQRAEMNREKMRKIYENNIYSSLEKVELFFFIDFTIKDIGFL